MRMPLQAPSIARHAGLGKMRSAIQPSGCDFFKCAAAVVTCVGVCAGGPAACLGCLASIGAEGCLDCF
jgi:hypothetical protein